MAKAAAEIMEVASAFSGPLGAFTAGELFWSDDPLVRKYPQLFRPITVRSSVRRTEPLVEQATAAPGEKRGA